MTSTTARRGRALKARFLATTSLAVLALAASCSAGRPAAPPATNDDCVPLDREARLEPAGGAYFGVNLDWERDDPAAYAGRLGRKPAVYVAFARFPMDAASAGHVASTADQVRAEGGMLMLTVEPFSGLGSVDAHSAAELAAQVATYNDAGVPVFLRFAHEMNGSWYPWSQTPQEYVRAFRQIAAAVHEKAPLTAMVWAPNYGGGYPFIGGQYEAKPGNAAFEALDTDGDGRLTMADDPYMPYYPGDDAADWVGMSLYHWGSAYPWGENELPEAGKFVAQLRGAYSGEGGDERAVPDFYGIFGGERSKPIAITETAAFYAPEAGAVAGGAIKELWWRQVFSEDVGQLRQVKMINWFEWSKYESEVREQVDWRVTVPGLVDGFRAALPASLSFAEGIAVCR